MFTEEVIKRLVAIYGGSGIINSFSLTPDLKKLFVFHTSNKDLSSNVANGLYVTFSVDAAIRQWSSWWTRRGYQEFVNVFTVPIDYDCHFCAGDSFERHNGGRGYIFDSSKLEFKGHVSKGVLREFIASDCHAISARDNLAPDVTKQLFDIESDDFLTLITCLYFKLTGRITVL